MEDAMDGRERVLVIGGTRGTGFLIVNRLLEEGYQVRALARNEERARESLSPKVEIAVGDITRRETLSAAFQEVDHIIFTAGVTQRPASDDLMRATNYYGMLNVLGTAGDSGFRGRILYMTTIGV